MITLFGAPGSGKTIQGKMLAKKFGWSWISSRDLFLATKDKDVVLALNNGMPIENKKSVEVFGDILEGLKESGNFKAVLDGFPANVSQLYWMIENDFLKYLDGAIILNVPRGELWKRMIMRGRVDDTRAAIERRQDFYDRTINGMVHVLRENSIRVESVNGCNSEKDVFNRVEEKLGEWRIISREKFIK